MHLRRILKRFFKRFFPLWIRPQTFSQSLVRLDRPTDNFGFGVGELGRERDGRTDGGRRKKGTKKAAVAQLLCEE